MIKLQKLLLFFKFVMPNYKIIEGKRKNSKNYVSEGFIYTKNNQDALKIRLRCHHQRDGCKGTAHIIDDNLSIIQKCDHGPEEQEVEKRETESKMKNLAETSCLTYRQIYDENVSSPKAMLQPFSKINSTLEKRRKKVLPPVPMWFFLNIFFTPDSDLIPLDLRRNVFQLDLIPLDLIPIWCLRSQALDLIPSSRGNGGNGIRTKEIELMEIGLTCSKFLRRSCEIELIS